MRNRSSRAPGQAAGSNRQAGYNLVMLMVLLTVLNILIAASLPSWSSVIRRDREEELISRGLQYAEAIRIFQNRFQRPPIRLEELVEVEPRSIRRLWKDPMTEDGKWVLIPLQGPSQPLQRQPPGSEIGEDDPESLPDGDGETGEGEGEEDGGGGFGPKKKVDVQVGPFKGVHSRSGKASFLVFNGKERYDEWHFTIELLGQGVQPGQVGGDPTGGGQQQGIPTLSSRWIGRPLPEFLQPRQGTGLPNEDENDPMGRGGRGGQRGRDPMNRPPQQQRP